MLSTEKNTCMYLRCQHICWHMCWKKYMYTNMLIFFYVDIVYLFFFTHTESKIHVVYRRYTMSTYLLTYVLTTFVFSRKQLSFSVESTCTTTCAFCYIRCFYTHYSCVATTCCCLLLCCNDLLYCCVAIIILLCVVKQ